MMRRMGLTAYLLLGMLHTSQWVCIDINRIQTRIEDPAPQRGAAREPCQRLLGHAH